MTNQITGIFGASGDLGSQMTNQLMLNGIECLGYDVNPPAGRSITGINQSIEVNPMAAHPRTVQSLGELIDRCAVIHWCAPVSTIKELGAIPDDTLVILHDSVMSNSKKAYENYKHRYNNWHSGSFAVAHCLMNESNRVVVCSDIGKTDSAVAVFEDMKLDPTTMTLEQHDKLMARSQAQMAIGVLCDLQFLKEQHSEGNLTASGLNYLEALRHRDSRWTRSAINAILSNPFIVPHLQEYIATLNKNINNQL